MSIFTAFLSRVNIKCSVIIKHQIKHHIKHKTYERRKTRQWADSTSVVNVAFLQPVWNPLILQQNHGGRSRLTSNDGPVPHARVVDDPYVAHHRCAWRHKSRRHREPSLFVQVHHRSVLKAWTRSRRNYASGWKRGGGG